MFHRIWARTATMLKRSDGNSHHEPVKLEQHPVHPIVRVRRVLDMVFPAYGPPRNVAARESAGRRRRRDDTQMDEDTSSTDSESTRSDERGQRAVNAGEEAHTRPREHIYESSTRPNVTNTEESDHPAVNTLCCCVWPSTFNNLGSRAARRHEGSTSGRQQTSVDPASGVPGLPSARMQMVSATIPDQIDTPPAPQTESIPVSEHTYSPSAHVRPAEEPSICIQAPRDYVPLALR